jgi:hypothetical protein
MSSEKPAQHASTSAFADDSKPAVEVNMKDIIRPLPSLLEEEKVQQFMVDMKVGLASWRVLFSTLHLPEWCRLHAD